MSTQASLAAAAVAQAAHAVVTGGSHAGLNSSITPPPPPHTSTNSADQHCHTQEWNPLGVHQAPQLLAPVLLPSAIAQHNSTVQLREVMIRKKIFQVLFFECT